MNAADGSKITSNRRTQSWRLLELYEKKKGGITWKPKPSKQLQFYLSEKARYWNVSKCNLSWFFNRCQWLKNVIFKQTLNSCKRRNRTLKIQ